MNTTLCGGSNSLLLMPQCLHVLGILEKGGQSLVIWATCWSVNGKFDTWQDDKTSALF